MFAALGRLVTRYWTIVAAAWAAVLIILLVAAPSIKSIQNNDDNLALPGDVDSLKANEALLRDFGTGGSQAVAAVIVERPGGLTGLAKAGLEDEPAHAASAAPDPHPGPLPDYKEREKDPHPGPLPDYREREERPAHGASSAPAEESAHASASDWDWIALITRRLREHAPGRNWDILSPADPNLVGNLVSRDRQAAVIKIALPYNFVSIDSVAAVQWMKKLIANTPPPDGLRVAVSGSAGYGHDYAAAAQTSLAMTTRVTVLAVIIILLITYRALLAAGLSLATVGTAVIVSVSILALGAKYAGWSASTIVQLFTIVIGFGAGVDFSLFFLSRYHEELGRICLGDRVAGPGATSGALASRSLHICHIPFAARSRQECREAIVRALAGTGPAIVASAGTVAAGLTLMSFAKFKVFSTAGPAVSVSVIVACLTSLTLVPALAFVIGPRTFWPRKIVGIRALEDIPASVAPIPNPAAHRTFWDRLADWTVRRPIRILVIGLAVLIPLAVVGWRGEVVYDTLADLPRNNQSVRGAAIFSRHFPRGEMAPVKVVVELQGPLAGGAWAEVASAVDSALGQRSKVQQVRSLLHPLGIRHLPDPKLDRVDAMKPQWAFAGMMLDPAYVKQGLPRYLGSRNGDRPQWRAALWELAIDVSPYSNDALNGLEPIRQAVLNAVESVPAAQALHPTVFLAGDSAQMRDLRVVTDRDFLFVGLLVVVAIIIIVTAVIRDLPVAVFVMMATILTYGAALALTGWIFHALFNIAGMDWKVNFFLFVILVAVGQDYNLFMLTRIVEERRSQPLRSAMQSAIARTGAIISSCGLIMAATLGSLAASPLRLLQELGVAFIIGLLIDTFLVRPLMVPAFVLLARRMGGK